MSNEKIVTEVDNLVKSTKFEVNKTSYENIVEDIKKWPEWKRKLCNEDLIVSANSEKI